MFYLLVDGYKVASSKKRDNVEKLKADHYKYDPKLEVLIEEKKDD